MSPDERINVNIHLDPNKDFIEELLEFLNERVLDSDPDALQAAADLVMVSGLIATELDVAPENWNNICALAYSIACQRMWDMTGRIN